MWMVKNSIESSGSLVVSPVRLTVLFGARVLLKFVGTGGSLNASDTRETVAAGLLPPRLSLLV